MINDYKERETCAHAHAFPERTRRIWWDCVQDNGTNPTSRKWAFLRLTPQNPPIYWSWKGRRVATDLNKHWIESIQSIFASAEIGSHLVSLPLFNLLLSMVCKLNYKMQQLKILYHFKLCCEYETILSREWICAWTS